MMPTADDVAGAIVEATRGIDGDLAAMANGVIHPKAQHYAMHALLKVFDDLEPFVAARLVGVPSGSLPPRHSDFSVSILNRVVRAIRKTAGDPEAPEPAKVAAVPKPAPVATAVAPGARLAAVSAHRPEGKVPDQPVSRADPDGVESKRSPVMERSGKFDMNRPGHMVGEGEWLTQRATERGKLQQMLAEAAANTARMQRPKD